MGSYERDYYREPPPSFTLRRPSTVVGTLVLINAAIYLADGLFCSDTHYISRALAVNVDTLVTPWLWWKFVTYGFAHAPSPSHILFNMLTLWFLGRDIENKYGSKEFVRLYLAAIVVAGLTWTTVGFFNQMSPQVIMYGASGGVVCVVILFAINFPHRMLLLFFVIPVPAWLVGAMVVLFDAFGAVKAEGSNIAFTAHLGGAAFACLYHFFNINLGQIFSKSGGAIRSFRPGPKLRVKHPDAETDTINERVDQILEKIHREGSDSLSRKERKILQDASRRYQSRR